jgi:ABC-type taurine transport system ATPase subunit
VACRWFSLDNPVFSTNKTDRHNITEILLKVASNTITITLISIHEIDDMKLPFTPDYPEKTTDMPQVTDKFIT